jgi:hypothetical protein
VGHATDRDLELARRVPDGVVAAGSGDAAQRLIEIVGENWMRFPMTARAELVEALLPVLEPLVRQAAEVTDRERGICEAIVAKWMERQ